IRNRGFGNTITSQTNKKKLKLANKQADIQAFLLSLHSKPPFPKQRFRKITSKRNCKIID
ncbi:hypothetical protein, partial [Segatella sp.]|uniref:hypothetical protein n=1 Tax=Segatella sp. TaxID=2974253 RepID=UPI003AB595F7